MTVRKLISELKKMPQNLQIEYAHHDNSPWETAGYVCYVEHCIKADIREKFSYNIQELSPNDKEDFESKSKQWVVIRG